MKSFFLFLILSVTSTHASAADKKEWVCRSGISGNTGSYFKGCHANKAQAQRLAKADCVSYVKQHGYKWGRSPEDCLNAKTCSVGYCEPPAEPRDPSSPFCNYNSECRAGSFCIGGICRAKDDSFNNKCTSDADCGGAFDRGHCHPFGYCE